MIKITDAGLLNTNTQVNVEIFGISGINELLINSNVVVFLFGDIMIFGVSKGNELLIFLHPQTRSES